MHRIDWWATAHGVEKGRAQPSHRAHMHRESGIHCWGMVYMHPFSLVTFTLSKLV